jgi:hypothetical protein
MSAIVRPGISTAELGHLADEELYKANAIGLSKNYPTYKPGEGFPASSCISVNEEVVHGIPTDKRILKEGDIVHARRHAQAQRLLCRHRHHRRGRAGPASGAAVDRRN